MFIGNILVLILIYKTFKKRADFVNQGKDTSDLDKLIPLGILLMFTTITYLLLTFPYLVYLIMMNIENYLKNLYITNEEFRSAITLFRTSTLSIAYLNNCINFLLYCIGSRQFRQEFINMIRENRCLTVNSVYPDYGQHVENT